MDEDFIRFSDEVVSGDDTKRSSCEKCRRPQRVCWCSYLPEQPVKINGKIVVLQHPDEEKRNLKTGPMLYHGMTGGQCLIYYGKKFPSAKHKGLEEILKEPHTYVLYPGLHSQCLTKVSTSRPKEEAYNLVLIDGTWKQAKSMYFHSPVLQTLPQVSLPELGPSLYVIRTQPSEYCLSTVESAALAMSIMEEDKSIVDKLVYPLKALCTFQLNYGAVEHQDKVTLLELGQYRKPVGKRTIKFLRQTAHKQVLEKL